MIHKSGVKVNDRRFFGIVERSRSFYPFVTKGNYNRDTAKLIEEINRLTKELTGHVGKKKRTIDARGS